MKTKPNIKAAREDGRETGKKFDGSENWSYTPGGPIEFASRKYDAPEFVKHCECLQAENIAWWEGFNETCLPSLRKDLK